MKYDTLMNKFSKAAAIDKEAACDAVATALQDAYLIDVEDTKDWVQNAEPYEVAEVVKQSGLSLDCDYIMVPDSGYYSQYIEADTITELFENGNLADLLEELEDDDQESLAADLDQLSRD